MRQKLVAGNWKMHGRRAANQHLLEGVISGLDAASSGEVAVCVPYPYLSQVETLLTDSPVRLGAQNVSAHGDGAFTGEVSAGMLADFGCTYVIVGHSERRSLFCEDDEAVVAKCLAALAAGLRPVVCVGESLQDRESGNAAGVVLGQLAAVVAGQGFSSASEVVVAYEPVWAIGTGKTASPEQVQEMHVLIRSYLLQQGVDAEGVRILYGGSVKAANAAELFALADVDGALVGGASLVAEDFLAICRAAG